MIDSKKHLTNSPSERREQRRRERDERGKRILDAAARVFGRHGLESATIEMIANEAEVAVGTIYLHFASRDDLYLNLVVERAENLRTRYLEVQSQGLAPLEELRAMAGVYLDHLRESRELFSRLRSVSFARMRKGLRHASEIRNYKRATEFSHETFAVFERSTRRVFKAGLISASISPAQATGVIWAILDGAFGLMSQEDFFREVTGLEPLHFVENALDSLLDAWHSGAVSRSNGDRFPGRKWTRKPVGLALLERMQNARSRS